MRILLDECVPRRLRKFLLEHDVRTVAEMGWTSLRNGALLTSAQREFLAFVTTDRHLPSQQNLSKFTLLVVVLVAKRNKLEFLLPLVPETGALGWEKLVLLGHSTSRQRFRFGKTAKQSGSHVTVCSWRTHAVPLSVCVSSQRSRESSLESRKPPAGVRISSFPMRSNLMYLTRSASCLRFDRAKHKLLQGTMSRKKP